MSTIVGNNLIYMNKFRKNNQLDASISKIYFGHKTLHILGILCAHHQGLKGHCRVFTVLQL